MGEQTMGEPKLEASTNANGFPVVGGPQASGGFAGSEMKRGWPLVLVAALGSAVGISGIFNYTVGVFAPYLHDAIQLSRGQFGTGFLCATLALAIGMPIVGFAIDRVGVRAPAIFGALMLAVGFLLLGHFTVSVPTYLLFMAFTGLFASASCPIGYARAVSSVFDQQRGLALGLLQVGIGIAGMTAPPLVALVNIRYGWQAGYDLLACIAVLGVLPALIGLRGRAAAAPVPRSAESDAAFWNVVGGRTFRIQIIAFMAMGLGFTGMVPHLVPMLREFGLTPESAAATVGLLGLSVIGSRLIIGFLSDHIHAPYLAIAACLICGAGFIALALVGPAAAPFTTIAIGAALGCESDMIAFLTARYFGMAAFGRVYALQFAAFMVTAGLGPTWVGYLADATGGYREALLVSCAPLLLAIGLFLLLPTTRGSSSQKVA
jgi:MFS family permease